MLKVPALIVKNTAMVDKQGNPRTDAMIMIDAIMVHPDMIDKLIGGLQLANCKPAPKVMPGRKPQTFTQQNFKIIDTAEYKTYINAKYPDKKDI